MRRLHLCESATGTVEWVMLITVALMVLTAIYYFARWAMDNTAKSVKKVEGKK